VERHRRCVGGLAMHASQRFILSGDALYFGALGDVDLF
jgi:hypothetical protein